MVKLTNQLCGDLQLAVCLSRGDSHLKTNRALMDVWQASKITLDNF